MAEVRTYFKEAKTKRRRAWNSTLPQTSPKARKRRAEKKQAARQGGVTDAMRRAVYARDGGRCQAEGMHHRDCPGDLPAGDWIVHHVWPRSKGGPDTMENLITLWCPMGLGLNGCHGRAHREEAKRFGLLSDGP